MRLIPDAIPCSEIILNPRISQVFETWVPPHSSMDTPGTSTTRTYGGDVQNYTSDKPWERKNEAK